MSDTAHTRSSLARQAIDLGIKPGMVLMVHAAFGKVGWTDGGPCAAIEALMEVLGPTGTLVMPAATPQLGPPEGRTPSPETVFDKATTPTEMGLLAETFRTWPGTLRSAHPIESVCANGPKAEEIVRAHSLAFCEGPDTPFEALYTLDGYTLLLGVGFNRCTSLHYAEFLSAHRRTTTHMLPIVEDGAPRWMRVETMAADNSTHFPIVGARFVESGAVAEGKIGLADSFFFSTRDLVRFATPYFDEALKPA